MPPGPRRELRAAPVLREDALPAPGGPDARNGGIVLMHKIRPGAVAKLEEVVQQVLAGGYCLGMVPDADFESSLR